MYLFFIRIYKNLQTLMISKQKSHSFQNGFIFLDPALSFDI